MSDAMAHCPWCHRTTSQLRTGFSHVWKCLMCGRLVGR